MDPALIQQVLAAGNDPQADQVKRQQMMIDQLRKQSMQAPQTQMAGRLVAPNWGQSISNAMMGAQASRMQPGVDQMNQQVMQRGQDARSKYLDALMMAMRRDYPQMSGGPVLPPNGMEDR